MPELTLKQQAFVDAYLRLRNGTAAYKEVYGTKSDNAAAVGACLNIRKPNVSKAIQQRREELEALNPICTVEELAEGWSDDIRLDLGELVDEHGAFKSPKDLPKKIRRLIQGVKIKESIVEEEGGAKMVLNRWIEYKLPDKQKARIELGKRVGFYPDEKPPFGDGNTIFVNIISYREKDAPKAVKLLKGKVL